jgi:hypothetical protein
MPVQPLRKEGDRNLQTAEEAITFVKHVESLFMPWNIDALVGGFTEDCVVVLARCRSFTVERNYALSSLRAAASKKATGSRKVSARWRTTPSPMFGKANGWTPKAAPPCAASASKFGLCATAKSRSGRLLSTPAAPTTVSALTTFCGRLAVHDRCAGCSARSALKQSPQDLPLQCRRRVPLLRTRPLAPLRHAKIAFSRVRP